MSADCGLTGAPIGDPSRDERPTRRRFTTEEKLAIVREAEAPGISVAAVARRRGIVTSVLFRWRAELGLGRKGKVVLAAVRSQTAPSDNALVLHDLLPMPDGMAAVDLPDGRRVFAPLDVDPDAVRRHVANRETTP